MKIETSPYKIAERFVGIEEIPGKGDNHQIMSMLRLDMAWPEGDEVPWCSAFCNYVAWLLRLPRSKSLRARSWLKIGTPISIEDAKQGFDVVILSRGANAPGPSVIKAPGHVGFFSSRIKEENVVFLLGGNQSDSVCVDGYSASRILGVRRLYES